MYLCAKHKSVFLLELLKDHAKWIYTWKSITVVDVTSIVT